MFTVTRAKVVAGTAMLAGLAGAAVAAVVGAPAANAASAPVSGPVAYVRDGAVYLANGTTEKRLTSDNVNSRPRLSPDRTRIAYLHNGTAWVMNADGTGQRKVSDRVAGGPSWSPDGKWIAFAGPSCTGGPGVFRVSSTTPGAASEPLFPQSCRGVAAPQVAMPMSTPAPGGTLAERLESDNAVAWSPDGTKIAFRGGECENIADDCLSVGNVATGGESAVVVYGGGGNLTDGFAVVPAWRADGKKIAFTAYAEGSKPVHVVEANADGSGARTIGVSEDREMVYARSGGKALVTAKHNGASWVVVVDLATGKRTPYKRGSQPSV